MLNKMHLSRSMGRIREHCGSVQLRQGLVSLMEPGGKSRAKPTTPRRLSPGGRSHYQTGEAVQKSGATSQPLYMLKGTSKNFARACQAAW
jgi:hypothetical protein